MIRIAVDAMSGDRGPAVAVEAALGALARHADLELILAGDEQVLAREIARQDHQSSEASRLTVEHAGEVVGMCESPARALRQKKDSSMRRAIDLVADSRAQGCVSSGNTGALMATARFVLKTLPSVERPAILAPLPARSGRTLMLDLGANTESTSAQLLQFAVMGAVLARAVDGIESPRVGLLNIGSEEGKGNRRSQESGDLLSASPLNYVGFVEGDDIYLGDVDVVVCDGFEGNIALKTSEGLGKLIGEFLREEFSRNMATRAVGLMAKPVLNAFRQRVDSRNYNGATLVGLQHAVIKSHGDADALAFGSAIDVARTEVEKNVPSRISDLVTETLSE